MRTEGQFTRSEKARSHRTVLVNPPECRHRCSRRLELSAAKASVSARSFSSGRSTPSEISSEFAVHPRHRFRKDDDGKMAGVRAASVSYAELQRMPEDGRQYELYDGEVRVVPSPSNRHQVVLHNLFALFLQYEQQSGDWKMCFRAGREATATARTAAAAWLKDVENAK